MIINGELNIIERVPETELHKKCHYLPHRSVVKLICQTGKGSTDGKSRDDQSCPLICVTISINKEYSFEDSNIHSAVLSFTSKLQYVSSFGNFFLSTLPDVTYYTLWIQNEKYLVKLFWYSKSFFYSEDAIVKG